MRMPLLREAPTILPEKSPPLLTPPLLYIPYFSTTEETKEIATTDVAFYPKPEPVLPRTDLSVNEKILHDRKKSFERHFYVPPYTVSSIDNNSESAGTFIGKTTSSLDASSKEWAVPPFKQVITINSVNNKPTDALTNEQVSQLTDLPDVMMEGLYYSIAKKAFLTALNDSEEVHVGTIGKISDVETVLPNDFENPALSSTVNYPMFPTTLDVSLLAKTQSNVPAISVEPFMEYNFTTVNNVTAECLANNNSVSHVKDHNHEYSASSGVSNYSSTIPYTSHIAAVPKNYSAVFVQTLKHGMDIIYDSTTEYNDTSPLLDPYSMTLPIIYNKHTNSTNENIHEITTASIEHFPPIMLTKMTVTASGMSIKKHNISLGLDENKLTISITNATVSDFSPTKGDIPLQTDNPINKLVTNPEMTSEHYFSDDSRIMENLTTSNNLNEHLDDAVELSQLFPLETSTDVPSDNDVTTYPEVSTTDEITFIPITEIKENVNSGETTHTTITHDISVYFEAPVIQSIETPQNLLEKMGSVPHVTEATLSEFSEHMIPPSTSSPRMFMSHQDGPNSPTTENVFYLNDKLNVTTERISSDMETIQYSWDSESYFLENNSFHQVQQHSRNGFKHSADSNEQHPFSGGVISIIFSSALAALLLTLVILFVYRKCSVRRKVYVTPSKRLPRYQMDKFNGDHVSIPMDDLLSQRLGLHKCYLTKPMPPAVLPQELELGLTYTEDSKQGTLNHQTNANFLGVQDKNVNISNRKLQKIQAMNKNCEAQNLKYSHENLSNLDATTDIKPNISCGPVKISNHSQRRPNFQENGADSSPRITGLPTPPYSRKGSVSTTISDLGGSQQNIDSEHESYSSFSKSNTKNHQVHVQVHVDSDSSTGSIQVATSCIGQDNYHPLKDLCEDVASLNILSSSTSDVKTDTSTVKQYTSNFSGFSHSTNSTSVGHYNVNTDHDNKDNVDINCQKPSQSKSEMCPESLCYSTTGARSITVPAAVVYSSNGEQTVLKSSSCLSPKVSPPPYDAAAIKRSE